MNMNYSFFLFVCLQLAIRYNNAKVTVDTKCTNGYLIQMSGHFECACNEGYVLKNENTCEKTSNCASLDDINKTCANYAVCANSASKEEERAIKCVCMKDYVLNQGKCIPQRCINIVCGSGKCVIDPNNANLTICSCNIGTVAQTGTCQIAGETKCTLKCKENEKCEKKDIFYTCVKQEGSGQDGGGEDNGGDQGSNPTVAETFHRPLQVPCNGARLAEKLLNIFDVTHFIARFCVCIRVQVHTKIGIFSQNGKKLKQKQNCASALQDSLSLHGEE
ncbi:28 kDa ookinete surface protein (P28) [Plasmodium ovale curtisi]|uniref:28 kDa ookinete surface protein (P28) n=1 Tax=Plasmodium ovale curtisi TaxID=864141 RepID=A0A1A8VPM7_PLAOA|nr:28 kDa ookinete surface protein (P28) [Plasmodium ovale curtisi]